MFLFQQGYTRQKWPDDDAESTNGDSVRPYTCNYCNYSSLKKYITRHVLTHTGEKPFRCPYCSFRAARKINIEKHVRKAHSSKKKSLIRM